MKRKSNGMRLAVLLSLSAVFLVPGCAQEKSGIWGLAEEQMPQAAKSGEMMKENREGVTVGMNEKDASPGNSASSANPGASANSASIPATAAPLVVYVCGEVLNPDVYTLEPGSRMVDAVRAAGGMTPNADANAVNLAEPVRDGMRVYIPSVEESVVYREEPEQGEDAENGAQKPVNINTAGKSELMTLPGIGEARAEAIIAWREENGPFLSCEDIMRVSGIKEASFRKLEGLICVD